MEGCSGGLVSLNCKREASHGRRAVGPNPQISKADYAAELASQIVDRKEAAARGNVPVSDSNLPWHRSDQERSRVQERGMGMRHGGPMMSVEKNRYAAELDAQCVAAKARRDADAQVAAMPEEGMFGGKGEERQKPRKAMPPKMPSKESYAQELSDQVAAAKQTKQVPTPQGQYDDVLADNFSADHRPKNAGRRCVSQQPISKSAYAEDLAEQIASRKANQEAERQHLAQRDGGMSMPSNEKPMKRGRRPEAQIAQPSSREYLHSLQAQMAAKNERRANEVFEAPAEGAALMRAEPEAQPKARVGPRDVPSKVEYAASLKAQMVDKDWRSREAQVEKQRGDFFAIGAGQEEKGRGRRHQIEHPSKSQLGAVLRGQMAAKDAERAAIRGLPPLDVDVDWKEDFGGGLRGSGQSMSGLARSGAMLTGMPLGMAA
mmetsp:Transcript_12361/g.29027  ORF Transcript_12361/g.29027 Transcript_12361/m.29027 type:complete len:432 (+) Transcript_12361:104-1399(+)